MRALLLAAWLAAPEPGQLALGPASPAVVTIEDARGRRVATAHVRDDAVVRISLPEGTYQVRGAGPAERVEVGAGETTAVTLPGAGELPRVRRPPARPVPKPPPEEPPAPEHPEPDRAWRAPLMATFVPGLGHAWAGKPLWGVGILASTVGALTGAVVLGLRGDPSDGATPSDASRSPGYARLGGLAALSSVAGALYVGQIFDAHRVEKGERLRPVDPRVQLRFDRLSAVSMAPGRPRAALYDDLSLATMVRVSPRVRVGAADASVKLGPGLTVLQLGARATAMLFGPDDAHPHRRLAVHAGGGLLGQLSTRRRTVVGLEPDATPQTQVEREGGAVPYVLGEARLFVAPRWSVGALGRFGVPLTPRRYAGGRALPAFGPTLELGVSLGVNL